MGLTVAREGGPQFAAANYFSLTLCYSENTHEINVEFYHNVSILAVQNINTLEKQRLIFFHKVNDGKQNI